MIYEVNTQSEADAISGPKHVWHNLNKYIVYTGIDIPVSQNDRQIPDYAFRDRFADSEMSAFLALAFSGDISAQKLMLKLTTASNGIPMDREDVVSGMSYLVTKGILTEQRKNEILA
jgi:hypothetical protein